MLEGRHQRKDTLTDRQFCPHTGTQQVFVHPSGNTDHELLAVFVAQASQNDQKLTQTLYTPSKLVKQPLSRGVCFTAGRKVPSLETRAKGDGLKRCSPAPHARRRPASKPGCAKRCSNIGDARYLRGEGRTRLAARSMRSHTSPGIWTRIS